MKKLFTAALLLLAASFLANANDVKSIDLQSVFGLHVPSVGSSPVRWAKRVSKMTGGKVNIKVHGAGDFVPSKEVFGAVSSGAIPMGFDWAGYWADFIPVANLIGAMPFGPSPQVAFSWMFKGGGLAILQKAYDPYNVKVIPCYLVVSEAGGWFNKDINSVKDFKGLKMRISGLGGQALARLGANTQLIPASEIFVSLETGRIDASEFSTPQLDLGFGFHKIAKNYYFPGWHQPSSWNSILINKDIWNLFSTDQQDIMVDACMTNISENLSGQLHAQADALKKIHQAGVTVKRFPEEVLNALRIASEYVLKMEAQRNPIFKEAYQSLTAYQKRTNEWQSLQVFQR